MLTFAAGIALGGALAGAAWFWAAKRHKAKLQAAVDDAHNLQLGQEVKNILGRAGIKL